MNKVVIFAAIVGAFVAGCNVNGVTTTGSTSSKVDLNKVATIGCALAQVAGATAGTIASQVGANVGSQITEARAVTDTACAALIKLGGIVKEASSASVSSTTK